MEHHTISCILLLITFSFVFVVFYQSFSFCYSYIGRPVAASTATGSKAQHLKELASFLGEATRID